MNALTSSVLGRPVLGEALAHAAARLWPVLIALFAVGLVVAMAAVWFLVDRLGSTPRHRESFYVERTTIRQPGGEHRG